MHLVKNNLRAKCFFFLNLNCLSKVLSLDLKNKYYNLKVVYGNNDNNFTFFLVIEKTIFLNPIKHTTA